MFVGFTPALSIILAIVFLLTPIVTLVLVIRMNRVLGGMRRTLAEMAARLDKDRPRDFP